MAEPGTLGWPWWLSLIVGAAVAVVALLANLVAGFVACSMDTSYCAESRDALGVFYGTITDAGDRPVGGARFHFRDDTLEHGDPGPVFESDPDGSYCVRWPVGSTRPFAQPLDPDLRGSLVEPDVDGTYSARDCQTTDERGPWHSYQDLTSTWQYILLILLPTAAFLLFTFAGVMARASPGRAGQLRLAGGALLAINIVLFFVLWNA